VGALIRELGNNQINARNRSTGDYQIAESLSILSADIGTL